MVEILIGGDVCPVGDVQSAFINGNTQKIFNDLLEEIACADLSIVNLECPLVSEDSPIDKSGPVLGAPTGCVQGFVDAKWNVLNLANNHIYDHGTDGLKSTIRTIKRAELSFVGAGSNIEEAQKPFIKEINGRRIVVYSMAEHEFNIANKKTPGANPLDLINFVNAIRLYKEDGIFIVLIHGGNEHYPYPSPEMVRRCRFMVDIGADAVICCHTHCPLPWEIYADRPIVYGLGNLVFEAGRPMQDGWYKGYLAKLAIDETKVNLEVVPYLQSRENLGVRKMNENSLKIFFDEMQKKTAQVKDNEFLEDQWGKYCREHKEDYLAELFGYNRMMRKASSLLLKTLHSKKDICRALHIVQCEAHQEILNTLFREEIQED